MSIKIIKNKGFLKQIAKLGIPIALQNLLSFSTTFVNMLMVAKLGDAAVSGVYMGNQVKILLTVFLAGIEGAILAICAQYHGNGNCENIKKIAGIGATIAGFVSLVLTSVCFLLPEFIVRLFTDNLEIIDTGSKYLRILCLSFLFFSLSQVLLSMLRSVECANIGFFASLTSLGVNLILGYFLLFGKLGFPKLGINGCAIATVAATASEFLLVLLYTIFIDKKLNLRTKNLNLLFKFERKLISEFIKIGAPVILGQLVWGANILFASAVMGRQGKAAVTAMSIAGSLLNLSHIVTNGTAGALGIVIGKTIGAGRKEEAVQMSNVSQIIFLILGALTSAFILLIKKPFISIYNISPEAIIEAKRFINVLAVVTFGTCYQSAALNGILKSAKDTRFVFEVELFSVLFVIFPLTLISVRLLLTPWMIFAALKSDQFIKCLPAAMRVNKFKQICLDSS